jgi:hypothetical protein
MREYDDYGEYRDDHIWLYTPVLQRVIILTAVIIAVPVLMWTVTTFVRSYVARPKVPALQQVAASESPARAPVASPAPPIPTPTPDQTAAAPPRGDTGPALSDAGAPAPDIKKGPPIAPAGDVTATAPVAQSANTSPPIQTRPVQGSEPAMAISPAGAAAGNTAPAAAAASPMPPPRPAENTTVAAVPGSSSDRGLAWPNPNSKSPPGFGPPAAAAPAASTPLPRTATVEVVPPGEPLRGPIPLPRHRPSVYAVAAVTSSGMASSGPVPLPPVRPSDAPAETASPVTVAPYNYEPSLAGN